MQRVLEAVVATALAVGGVVGAAYLLHKKEEQAGSPPPRSSNGFLSASVQTEINRTAMRLPQTRTPAHRFP